jgi:hypothetical protein
MIKIKNNVAVSDSGFIFNPDSGESFTVNPIGVEIIKLLKEGKDVATITAELQKTYATDAQTLEKDAEDFIGLLRNFSIAENE